MTQLEQLLRENVSAFDYMLGTKVDYVRDGEASLSLLVEQRHCNPIGTVHGGVLMALADTAGACACFRGQDPTPTVEGKLNFLRPCRVGDTVTMVATELKHGRTLLTSDIKGYNQHGDLIAAGLYTYVTGRNQATGGAKVAGHGKNG